MVGVPRAKTTVPRLPREFVSRPDLLAALDRGDDRALTLVCAPPGYGKTVLLADWAGRPDVRCAWVSLDEDDDDPRLLWGAILAALVACPDVPGSSPLHSLVVPATTVGVDFFAELADALASVPSRLRLVLDDAHHLRSPITLHGVEFLLRDRRSNVRLILASRVDPALPIARLRLEERLTELRIDQLTFSIKETGALAGLCGLSLTNRQVARLHARTDGWVAGIRLAALPLRAHPEPDAFLAAFSGDERPVADYLVDEVLSHLSDDDCEVLRRVSICDPIPSGLATELTGRRDAVDVLSALERRTGLVTASGPHRDEFRIQELMRSYLGADLIRHGPARAAQLHRQAALWWGIQRRPAEALHHAARAGDSTLMSGLLHRWAAALVARGDDLTLSRAVDTLDARGAVPDAWVSLVSAQIHLGRGERAAGQADVRRARALTVDGKRADDLVHFQTATQQLLGMGGSADDEGPPPKDAALAALVLAGRGAAPLFAWTLDGAAQENPAALLDDLEAALAVARDQRFGLLELQCLCLIATAALALGDHGRAGSAADAAISAAAAGGWSDKPWTVGAHAVLAEACLISADPVRALEVSAEGLRMPVVQQEHVIRFALRCARGGALFDLGNRPAGLHELQEAHAEMGATPIPVRLAAVAALLEHRAALLLDLPAAASTSMGRLAAQGGADAELMLMKGWTEAAAGSPLLARRAVAPLVRARLRPVLPSTVVEAWLVEAWAALCLGERSAARQALHSALAVAEPLDSLRPFSLAGQGIRVLLVDQLGATDPGTFAYRCLAVRPRSRRIPSPGLSAREHNVLVHLTSLNNLGEIADDLDVSVNTIKSHVRAIYGKLGVTTRRTAVLTALERGLLT